MIIVNYGLGESPQSWKMKLQTLHELEFFEDTREMIMTKWGNPDPSLPKELSAKGIVQYAYIGSNRLPSGMPPCVRFRFDSKGRLIEVAMGFAYGPPVQKEPVQQPTGVRHKDIGNI